MTVCPPMRSMVTRQCVLRLCRVAFILSMIQSPSFAFAQSETPSVTITAPVAGEWLLAGTTYEISWTATNVPEGATFDVRPSVQMWSSQPADWGCSRVSSHERTCTWTIDESVLPCFADDACPKGLLWPLNRIEIEVFDAHGRLITTAQSGHFGIVVRPAPSAGPFLFVTDEANAALWRIDAVTGQTDIVASGGFLDRPSGIGIGGFDTFWPPITDPTAIPIGGRFVSIADTSGIIVVDSRSGDQSLLIAGPPATHVTVARDDARLVTSGGSLYRFPFEPWPIDGPPSQPQGVAIEAFGGPMVYVADKSVFGGSPGVTVIDPGWGAKEEACSGPPFDTPVALAVRGGELLVADTTALGTGGLIDCRDGRPVGFLPVEAPSDVAWVGPFVFVVSAQTGNVTRIELSTGQQTVLAHFDRPTGIELAWDFDPVPSLSIEDAEVVEGDSGFTDATFVVTLSSPSTDTVTVDYKTSDEDAEAGTDYAATSGTVTFEPGTTSMQVTVPVFGDRVAEQPFESFRLTLSGPMNARILRGGWALGLIVDDDTPAIRIEDARAVEGPSATIQFPVTVSLMAAYPITVDYAAIFTHTPAPVVRGTLTIPPGTQTATITLPIDDDRLDEADEIFAVLLSNPLGAAIADGTAIGTIVDDDPLPRLSIADIVVTESVNTLSLPVRLSEPSGRVVHVSYQTSNLTALAGGDYTAKSGTISFQPGQTTVSIPLRIIDDTVRESSEQFRVTLSPTSTAVLEKSRGTVTILDND